RQHVVTEGGDIGLDPRCGNRSQVDDRVQAAMSTVDRAERIGDLAGVGEIDAGEPRASFADEVEGDDIVASGAELTLDDRHEFAGGTGDGDPQGQAGGA